MNRIVYKILLVEPDGVLAEVTAFRLELLGYQVEVVENADDAFLFASNMKPDLVITDMTLGDKDATGLIEQLASHPQTNEIPVMVLSLDASLDRVTAVHRVGATEFLVVPFQPDVLQTKVANLLAKSGKGDVSKAKASLGLS